MSLRDEWETGEEQTIVLPIYIAQVEKVENVSLVVFIQDNDTKEIYQVEQLRLTDANSNLVTATKKGDLAATNFMLYPNPTSKVLNIKFGGVLTAALPWQIYDLKGQVLQRGEFQAGQKTYSISLADTYAAGIYVLEFSTEDGRRSETFILTR